MRAKRAKRRAAALLCAAALLVSLIPAAWAEEAFLRAGSAAAAPGETCSVYVSGVALEALASVEGFVAYDAEVLEVTDAAMLGSFSGSGTVNTKTAGQVAFNGVCLDGVSGQADILRLDFRVKQGARAGDYPVEVIVSEAYDAELQPMALGGAAGTFTVRQPQAVTKTVYFYGSRSGDTLRKGDIVTVTAGTYDSQGLSAGKLAFYYDASLFSCAAAEPLAALKDAAVTVSTERSGYVSAAFASGDALPSGELLQLALEVIADTETETDIVFSSSDLYDGDMTAMNGIGFTQRASLRRTDVVTAPPALRLHMPAMAAAPGEFTATVLLDGSSALAAGDFRIDYDTAALTCIGVEKGSDIANESGVYIETDPDITGGSVRFTFICQSGLEDDTVLLTLRFRAVKEGAVTLTPSAVSTPSDTKLQPVALEMQAGECLLLRVGNVDGSGSVNIQDMQALYSYLSQGTIPPLFGETVGGEDCFRQVADVNGSGSIDILDYQYLYQLILS